MTAIASAGRVGRTGGFTLVEVMAAILVFGVGLLGIVALHIVARKGNTSAQNLTAATSIAEHWMERLDTESTMWNSGPGDLTSTAAPMMSALGAGVSTVGSSTGWVAPPENPLLNREMRQADVDSSSGALLSPGDYCTQYRLTTLVADQLLRAEVRITWWKEGVQRPSNWASCPAPSGAGGNPDITKLHMVTLSSTIWRNGL